MITGLSLVQKSSDLCQIKDLWEFFFLPINLYSLNGADIDFTYESIVDAPLEYKIDCVPNFKNEAFRL